jgi:hypothetical protein
MTHNAFRPAAIALAMAFTLTLWAPTLSTGATANAAAIPQMASGHLVVASSSSIVLM